MYTVAPLSSFFMHQQRINEGEGAERFGTGCKFTVAMENQRIRVWNSKGLGSQKLIQPSLRFQRRSTGRGRQLGVEVEIREIFSQLHSFSFFFWVNYILYNV